MMHVQIHRARHGLEFSQQVVRELTVAGHIESDDCTSMGEGRPKFISD